MLAVPPRGRPRRGLVEQALARAGAGHYVPWVGHPQPRCWTSEAVVRGGGVGAPSVCASQQGAHQATPLSCGGPAARVVGHHFRPCVQGHCPARRAIARVLGLPAPGPQAPAFLCPPPSVAYAELRLVALFRWCSTIPRHWRGVIDTTSGSSGRTSRRVHSTLCSTQHSVQCMRHRAKLMTFVLVTGRAGGRRHTDRRRRCFGRPGRSRWRPPSASARGTSWERSPEQVERCAGTSANAASNGPGSCSPQRVQRDLPGLPSAGAGITDRSSKACSHLQNRRFIATTRPVSSETPPVTSKEPQKGRFQARH